MAHTTVSVFLLVCGVVGLAVVMTPKSAYSQGTSALVSRSSGVCWCGTNTACKWTEGNDAPECICKHGYIGSPPKCKPGPELWNLCFKDNSCGLHSECTVENGTRSCPYCAIPFDGSPPNCHTPEKCRDKNLCGPNSECDALYVQPCHCLQGFVGTPPNCRPGPAMLAQCNPYPCGPYANCRYQHGGTLCTCDPGYDGTPPHCKPGPLMWKICFKDEPCRKHSKCTVVDRVATCGPCDEGFEGDPPHCYPAVSHDFNQRI